MIVIKTQILASRLAHDATTTIAPVPSTYSLRKALFPNRDKIRWKYKSKKRVLGVLPFITEETMAHKNQKIKT